MNFLYGKLWVSVFSIFLTIFAMGTLIYRDLYYQSDKILLDHLKKITVPLLENKNSQQNPEITLVDPPSYDILGKKWIFLNDISPSKYRLQRWEKKTMGTSDVFLDIYFALRPELRDNVYRWEDVDKNESIYFLITNYQSLASRWRILVEDAFRNFLILCFSGIVIIHILLYFFSKWGYQMELKKEELKNHYKAIYLD
jgi:hypothetical protein